MIHYPRDKNRKISHYVRGKVVFKPRLFPEIPAKLHGPKGDRINESLLYYFSGMYSLFFKNFNVGFFLPAYQVVILSFIVFS